jgi:hypothetical protein
VIWSADGRGGVVWAGLGWSGTSWCAPPFCQLYLPACFNCATAAVCLPLLSTCAPPAAMAANDPATFQPSAAAISKAVYAAVGERYYKVLPLVLPRVLPDALALPCTSCRLLGCLHRPCCCMHIIQ